MTSGPRELCLDRESAFKRKAPDPGIALSPWLVSGLREWMTQIGSCH